MDFCAICTSYVYFDTYRSFFSVACPNRVQLVLFYFAPELVSYWAPRDLHRRAAYSICESSFLIHHGVYHNLFVCNDDSLTSYRFTTRTEQLTKCCEPLQKLRVSFIPVKKLASNVILLIVPRRYFCGGSYCFMSWCLIFCAVDALCM